MSRHGPNSRSKATMLGGSLPEILGGIDEAVRVRSCSPRYRRAVIRRHIDRIDPKKSLYKGKSHYIFLINVVTRGLRK